MIAVNILPEIRDGHDGFDRAVADCGYVDIDLNDVEMTVLMDTINATIRLSDRTASAP